MPTQPAGDASYIAVLAESRRADGGQAEALSGICSVLDDGYKWLEAGVVDLVLTDPPFNIAQDTNFHTYERNTINSYRFDKDKGWDSHTPDAFRQLLNQWALEFARVLRRGGSFGVFCADEYLSHLIDALRSAGLKPRRTLTWRKPNAVPVNRRHMMMSACEYVVLGVKGSKSVFNADVAPEDTASLTDQEVIAIADKAGLVIEQNIRKALSRRGARSTVAELRQIIAEEIRLASGDAAERATGIYDRDGSTAELCVPNYVAFNSKGGKRLHPTEKPVPLLRYLIELFSRPGDLILDPFSGSASTGEAAWRSGRRAILVERDGEFYRSGLDRLRALRDSADQSLF